MTYFTNSEFEGDYMNRYSTIIHKTLLHILQFTAE